MGSGKDAFGDYLVKKYGYRKLAFADELKSICKDIRDGYLMKAIAKLTDAFNYDPPVSTTNMIYEFAKYPIEKGKDRKLLQDLGMWARGHMENIWISVVKKRVKSQGDIQFCICDCRLENEFNAFPDYIRVYIDADLETRRERIIARDGKHDKSTEEHVSELEIDNMRELCDLIVDNNGSIEELYKQIDELFAYMGDRFYYGVDYAIGKDYSHVITIKDGKIIKEEVY
jgi:dephospho-CoA kinase